MISFNLILYAIIALSLVGLGIIVYRKIPVLANLSEEEMSILSRKKGLVQQIKEIDYKQHWLNFIISLEKFLRRLNIIFLKMENLLAKWIKGLRAKSKIMTQKSKEWMKQKEIRSGRFRKRSGSETKGEIPIKIKKEGISFQSKQADEIKEATDKTEGIEEIEEIIDEGIDEDLSISELKKPIKEEQKWIDLIVENPKNITAYKFLGLLYWKQHNYADAKASLEMAVKLGSKDKKVKEVLEELKRMDTK
jgi:tetratricopeptide (TPR) repeat protein